MGIMTLRCFVVPVERKAGDVSFMRTCPLFVCLFMVVFPYPVGACQPVTFPAWYCETPSSALLMARLGEVLQDTATLLALMPQILEASSLVTSQALQIIADNNAALTRDLTEKFQTIGGLVNELNQRALANSRSLKTCVGMLNDFIKKGEVYVKETAASCQALGQYTRKLDTP